MTRHTPAPWSVEFDGSLVMAGQVVATGIAPDGAPADEARANARMCSMAPDLVAIVEQFIGVGESFGFEDEGDPGNELMRQARAVVAKARGL